MVTWNIIAMQGVGTEEEDMQYNIVELLDENLKPTGISLYLHSTEIIPLIAKTEEEDMKTRIRKLKKTVMQLQKRRNKNEKDKKKSSNTATPKSDKI